MHSTFCLKMASATLRISSWRSVESALFPIFSPIFGKKTDIFSSKTKFFHSSMQFSRKKNILSDELPLKLRPADIKVLLLNESGQSIGIFPKIEAQKMSKQMDLKLVNVEKYAALQTSVERNSVHPIYKLISGQDLHELQMNDHEERKQNKKVSEKVLQLTSSATEHDIQNKIGQAETWLKKGDSVRVLILGRADTKSRMGEVHQEVLSKLKPLAKPAISGLSKSERNISFVLESVYDVGGDEIESQPVSGSSKSSDNVKKENVVAGSESER